MSECDGNCRNCAEERSKLIREMNSDLALYKLQQNFDKHEAETKRRLAQIRNQARLDSNEFGISFEQAFRMRLRENGILLDDVPNQKLNWETMNFDERSKLIEKLRRDQK